MMKTAAAAAQDTILTSADPLGKPPGQLNSSLGKHVEELGFDSTFSELRRPLNEVLVCRASHRAGEQVVYYRGCLCPQPGLDAGSHLLN